MQKLNEEQQKLVEDNYKLIYFFLKKYNLDNEDWYDIAAIGLCKAAKAYKPGATKFSTYAMVVMLNEIKIEKRKKLYKQKSKEISYNIPLAKSKDSLEELMLEDILENKKSSDLSSYYIYKKAFKDSLNAFDKIKQSIILDLISGYNQVEVCEKYKIYSQSYISKIYKDFKQKFLIKAGESDGRNIKKR